MFGRLFQLHRSQILVDAAAAAVVWKTLIFVKTRRQPPIRHSPNHVATQSHFISKHSLYTLLLNDMNDSHKYIDKCNYVSLICSIRAFSTITNKLRRTCSTP